MSGEVLKKSFLGEFDKASGVLGLLLLLNMGKALAPPIYPLHRNGNYLYQLLPSSLNISRVLDRYSAQGGVPGSAQGQLRIAVFTNTSHKWQPGAARQVVEGEWIGGVRRLLPLSASLSHSVSASFSAQWEFLKFTPSFDSWMKRGEAHYD